MQTKFCSFLAIIFSVIYSTSLGLQAGNTPPLYTITPPSPTNIQFGGTVSTAGQNILVATSDSVNTHGFVYLINPVTNQTLHTFPQTTGSGGIQLESDANYGVIGIPGSNTVSIYDLSTGMLARTLSGPGYGKSISLYGNKLLVGGSSSADLYDIGNGNLLQSISSATDSKVLIDQNGLLIGTANSAKVYDNSYSLQATFNLPPGFLGFPSNFKDVAMKSDEVIFGVPSSFWGGTLSGSVMVFERQTGALKNILYNIEAFYSDPQFSSGSGAEFGWQLEYLGDQAIISSPHGHSLHQGYVTRMDTSDNSFSAVYNSGQGVWGMGLGLDIYGSDVLIGSPIEGGGTGRVYIYAANSIPEPTQLWGIGVAAIGAIFMVRRKFRINTKGILANSEDRLVWTL